MRTSFCIGPMARVAALVVLGVSAQAASALTLVTLPSNNGSGGVFFNLSADPLSNISVTGFASYFGAATVTPVTVEVYVRPGTYVGSESGAAGWTLLDTVSSSSGADQFTLSSAFTLANAINVAAGSTVGVYMHSVTAGAGLRYQGTGATATQVFTDGTLTLTGGSARTGNVPFAGSLFQPRVFSGELYYDVTPIPEPGTYGLMALGLLGLGLRHLQQQRRASQPG